MSGYKRLLLAIDFSPATPDVLEIGTSWAEAFKARLDLVHVCALGGQGEPDAESALAALKLPGQGAALVDSRLVFRALSPDLGLLQLARDRHADLIVMGTHGRSGLQHIRLGSTAERVVQLAECPVLTVRRPDFSYQSP